MLMTQWKKRKLLNIGREEWPPYRMLSDIPLTAICSMDVLRSYLSRVRIPEPTIRIYKEECCISYDTPKSDGGLFVDMNSFLAFGKDYVGWNYEKSGNPIYLHIKENQKPVSEDRPLKKPTLLAIGIEGGFDNNDPKFETSYEIVIFPDSLTLPFPSVELPEKRFLVEHYEISASSIRMLIYCERSINILA